MVLGPNIAKTMHTAMKLRFVRGGAGGVHQIKSQDRTFRLRKLGQTAFILYNEQRSAFPHLSFGYESCKANWSLLLSHVNWFVFTHKPGGNLVMFFMDVYSTESA